MAAGEDCNEDLHTTYLTCCFVHNLKLVTSIVNVHLISCQMLRVTYGTYLTLVGTYGQLELTVLIAIRMFLLVLFVK